MPRIEPFRALLPKASLAAQICELPYDVMSTEEARTLAAGNPLSFLRVSKPEIDLPPGTNPSSDPVYEQGRKNFRALVGAGQLAPSEGPRFFLYRQTVGAHSQLGLVALASCDDYRQALVKKHELTRPDKEDDRVRHMEALEAQTGPAFLFYRSQPALDQHLQTLATSTAPYADFTAGDGVRHASWIVADEHRPFLQEAFAKLDCLYIADGHHRSAAAERVSRSQPNNPAAQGFLSVIFPHHHLRILPYNRLLKDTNRLSAEELLAKLERVFVFGETDQAVPARRHSLSCYFQKRWRVLQFRPELTQTPEPLDRLDVALLQRHVLGPIFGIDDPRTSTRIEFVGGIRGTGELEQAVDSGAHACAFSMFPTGIDELMAVADRGGIMPPKSTWFEPKLRDGMFSHSLAP